MVRGIGTDILEIARMEQTMARTPAFEQRIFTLREQEYCRQKGQEGASFAATFAGKEAVLKALGCGIGRFPLRELEVLREPSGRPRVRLWGGLAAYAQSLGVRRIELSLSHSQSNALAFAIALGGEEENALTE